MRKLIGLALVSACAASEPAGKSGVGSGSAPEPPAGSFTLSDAGFITQGSVWWSETSGPKLNGSIDAQDAQLVAKIDGKQVGPAAMIVGDAWSLQLPDGAIATNTLVDVQLELTADGKQAVDQDQNFEYDQGGPAIAIDAKVIDESGDTIEFTDNTGPVHTHAGMQVDLASGCPDLHMYAYLLDPNHTYGAEVSPNPLAFVVTAMSPVGVSDSGAWRVRLDDGTVVIDWAPIENGNVTLTREAVPQLGTRDGGMTVDFKFKDRFGHETQTSACFKYHPLAAPIAFDPIRWEAVRAPYLRDMIVNGSPVSSVLNSSAISAPQVGVVSQRFVQYSGEQVLMTMTFAQPSAQYAKTVSQRYVPGATGTYSCGNSQTGYSTDPHCNLSVYVTNTDTPTSGAVANWEWQSIIIDEASGLPPATCSTTGLLGSCTIPPRQSGQAPHAYRMITFVGGVRDLWPGPNDPFGEYYLGNNHYYTGYASQQIYKCTTMTTSNVFGVNYYACSYTTYTSILALGAAKLAFAPFQSAIKTSPGLTVGLTPQASGSAFMSPAYTWDGGTITF